MLLLSLKNWRSYKFLDEYVGNVWPTAFREGLTKYVPSQPLGLFVWLCHLLCVKIGKLPKLSSFQYFLLPSRSTTNDATDSYTAPNFPWKARRCPSLTSVSHLSSPQPIHLLVSNIYVPACHFTLTPCTKSETAVTETNDPLWYWSNLLRPSRCERYGVSDEVCSSI